MVVDFCSDCHLFFVCLTGQGSYFTLLLGTGYGRRSFLGVMEVLQKRFFHMFFIVLLIPVIWRKINQLERRRMIFLTLSIFLLLLQNYYDTSPHYLIFIVPYIVLLVVIVIEIFHMSGFVFRFIGLFYFLQFFF